MPTGVHSKVNESRSQCVYGNCNNKSRKGGLCQTHMDREAVRMAKEERRKKYKNATPEEKFERYQKRSLKYAGTKQGKIQKESCEEPFLFLGQMDQTCQYCGALGFQKECKRTKNKLHFGRLCCNQGKVKAGKSFRVHEKIKKMLKEDKYFREHTRMFNSGMAMASLVTDRGRKWSTDVRGPTALSITGQLSRLLGPLRNTKGQRPKFIQTYFYDANDATKHRLSNFKNLSPKERQKCRRIFRILHFIIKRNHKFIKSCMMADEIIKRDFKKVKQVHLSLHAHLPQDEYRKIHPGRMNKPTCNEVAILMPNDITAEHSREVVFQYRNDPSAKNMGLQTIPDYHKAYDSLQYPLFFCEGQDGWHCERKETLCEYLNYKLMERKGHFNPIHWSNKLGQQYIVDQFCKLELERLRYIENNQKTLRAENYEHLKTQLKKRGMKVGETGVAYKILPSTFVGSERNMHQQYLDSMAICQRMGKPHLFITMTCNPGWSEIVSQLEPGQTALDRPDIMCRVFKQKKDELLKDLKDGKVGGKQTARTHTIEFQKRGFPHVHILLWLQEKPNIDDVISAEIPNPTSKKSYDERGRLSLYDLVTKFMLHGPCGTENPECSCMRDGFCKYGFPKDYTDCTVLEGDAYPSYRRRSPKAGGHIFRCKKSGNVRTNADVIAHNPWLLQKYQCHINVEYVHTIKCMKYIFKYCYKGDDQVTTVFGEKEDGEVEEYNEVKQYQSNRYVSSVEAAWRIRQNELYGRTPSVYRLGLHLENQETVFYDADKLNNATDLIDKKKKSMLTAFFETNKREKWARSLLYREFAEYYTWNSGKRSWSLRMKYKKLYEKKPEYYEDNPHELFDGETAPQTIGRLYSIHPTQQELYALRLLLNHVRGPTCYKDLRRDPDNRSKIYETFLDAAIARKLVKNDIMWIEAMKEEIETQTSGCKLRDFFLSLLFHCEIGNPKALFNYSIKDLMADVVYKYKRHFRRYPLPMQIRSINESLGYDSDTATNEEQESESGSDDDVSVNTTSSAKEDKIAFGYKEDDKWDIERIAYNSCLALMEKACQENDRSLSEFGLPLPNEDIEMAIKRSINAPEEEKIQKDAEMFFNLNYEKLNEDQYEVIQTILGKIERKEGGLVFIDAPGGTGKTFTLNTLASMIRKDGNHVPATATSGIASTVLIHGCTAHKYFQLRIPIKKTDYLKIKKGSKEAELLKNMVFCIIDEAPMLHKLNFESIDRSLRDITGHHNKKFGGKLVVASGDFRQILPIVTGCSNRAKIVDSTLKFSSIVWDDDVTVLKLRKNMRVENEKRLHPNDLRLHRELKKHEKWLLDLGEGKLNIDGGSLVEIPKKMYRDSKDEVVDEIYGDLEENAGNGDYYNGRTILASTNEIVNEINKELIERLPGELYVKKSVDTVNEDSGGMFVPEEVLNAMNPSGIAEHELHLKVGALVILLKNLDMKKRHVNGTKYIVRKIYQYRLLLEKVSNDEDDVDRFLELPRIPMKPSNPVPGLELKRLQFPIKVAFGMTFNRAQGQSTKKCGIVLPQGVWTHGQIYVAFSRCGNPNNIFVWAEQSHYSDHIHAEKGKKYMNNIVFDEVLKDSLSQ